MNDNPKTRPGDKLPPKRSKLLEVPRAIKDQAIEAAKTDLSEISHKKRMSVIDYGVILASLYGIGTALGIVSGAAKNIVPDRNQRPGLYTACAIIGVYGAWKGYQTVTKFKSLEDSLLAESPLEKRLSQIMPSKYLYRT